MFKPLIPFEPVSRDTLPAGSQWIAQIKWDGVRMLAYENGQELRLVNRRLHDRTVQYPELVRPRNLCSASSYILDGEIIALDPDTGRPSLSCASPGSHEQAGWHCTSRTADTDHLYGI